MTPTEIKEVIDLLTESGTEVITTIKKSPLPENEKELIKKGVSLLGIQLLQKLQKQI